MSKTVTVPAGRMQLAQKIVRKAFMEVAKFDEIKSDPFVFMAVITASLSATYTELLYAISPLTPESNERYANVIADTLRSMVKEDLQHALEHQNAATRQ